MLVKPETRKNDCYIELLYGVFRRMVTCSKDEEIASIEKELDETLGAVNVFVSHTWHYHFKTLVESIEAWEKNWEKVNGEEHETFFYFVDYFAVNQHNQASDLSKLQDVVRHAKVTCLVLAPWEEPIPLLRCWCIYEIAKTELCPSTRLSVAFPPHQIKRFKKNFFDPEKVRKISRMFEGVDCENAKATKECDAIMIKKEIQSKLGGFQRVNELCIRNLRNWLIDQACEFADSEARGDFYNKKRDEETYEKAYWVLKNVGTFVRQQGKFEKSVKYLNDARLLMIKFYTEDLDEKEKEIQGCKIYQFEKSYGMICEGVNRKYKDADKRIKWKGCFLKILNSLANSLTDDKQFEKAKIVYERTLKWRKELLSIKEKDTKMTQFNLGVCLIHLRKFDEAEKILKENFDLWKKDDRKKNEKYRYWALFNLADIKSKTNRWDEAEKDFTDSCHGLSYICKVKEKDRFLSLAKVLWSKHLSRWAAECEDSLKKQTLLLRAQALVTEAYKNFRQTSDLTHPDTRLAARASRRLELQLNSKLAKKENIIRCDLVNQTYNRKWTGYVSESDERIERNIVRVMQWNLLADKLAYPDFKKGGFGCKFELLDWERCRKDKVCAEIVKYDPDVLVLVELDHYEDIRLFLQEDLGYESVWKKKNKNFYTDGTGIFWKKNRFTAGKIYKQPLAKEVGSEKKADQVFVAVELFVSTDSSEHSARFVLGGCHLKSTKKSKGENIRHDQCKQIDAILKKEFPDLPVILGSDMNAEAYSKDYKALAYPFIIESGLVSSYQSVLGKEPEFTSWKFRIDEDNSLFWYNKNTKNVKEWKYTIDFIFHSKELEALSVLNIPEEKEIDNAFGESNVSMKDVAFARKRCLLPNERCPSDHLPILAEISLGTQQDLEKPCPLFKLKTPVKEYSMFKRVSDS